MIRVGEGKTGIVMSGTITSKPYKDEDWSGKNREVYYSDLFCDCMVDTEVAPHISTEQLIEAIPGFDWTGGHSGRVLNEAMAAKLEELWAEYYYKYFGIFDNNVQVENSHRVVCRARFVGIISKRYGGRKAVIKIHLFAISHVVQIFVAKMAIRYGNIFIVFALIVAR